MLLLLLAQAIIVASTSIVSAEPGKLGHRPAAPLFNYSSLLSLPPEHIPYFLRNNQRVSKLCHQDPLCPFKVRYKPFCVSGCVHVCLCLDMTEVEVDCVTDYIHIYRIFLFH